MKTVLLTNIGNRNLLYHWAFIEKNKDKGDNFFEESKMIFEAFEEERANIAINILNPIIEKYAPEEIFLFVTHQEIPFLQDTYYIGKIIQKILEEKHITSHIIEFKEDPRKRDQAFLFFENFFSEHKELNNCDVVVSWSGWVPAMKEALNFYAVASLQNPKIIDVDENSNSIMESNIAQEYLKKFQKETLHSFIEHYDYWGAYRLLSSPHCLIGSVVFKNKLLYLHRKYNFDLTQANRYADEAFPCFAMLQMINTEAELSKYLNQKKMNLTYLLDNIEISYQKWEYTSLLGKLFSLKETYARRLLEQTINSKSEHLEAVQAEELKQQFPQYLKAEREIERHRNQPQKDRSHEIQLYYLNIDEFKLPDQNYLDLIKNLSNLNKIRNESIMAHGFKWIDQNEIDKHHIMKILKTIKHQVFWQKKNMFEEANKILIEMIKEL